MFQFRSSDRTIQSLETSAMADIVFLLLIFFLLSSSFILPTQIPVNPPDSDSAVTAKEEPLVLTLTRAGEYYVGNEKVAKNDLGTAIAARLRNAPQKSVVVRGDEEVPLGRLVEVMDLARKGGAEKLAIATEEKRSGRRR